MNWQQVWGVLKWVLAALVAGFVGQFGKSLALYLMKRRRARNNLGMDFTDTGAAPHPTPMHPSDSSTAKIEKKKAKAQVKRLKKS